MLLYVPLQDGDHTWCHTAARGLVTLQQMFGLIPNVYGQGKAAKVYNIQCDAVITQSIFLKNLIIDAP